MLPGKTSDEEVRNDLVTSVLQYKTSDTNSHKWFAIQN